MKTNVTILLFKNGKLVLAGSRSKKQAESMMISMTRILQESGCLVAE
jgi:TATA-box binding protein (TBP) (component of TFIID and TFIIIB)